MFAFRRLVWDSVDMIPYSLFPIPHIIVPFLGCGACPTILALFRVLLNISNVVCG